MSLDKFSRRAFLGTAAATLATPAIAQSGLTADIEDRGAGTVRRNASSFRTLDWRPHFNSISRNAILVDISSRALHFWGKDGVTYKLYPTSVPISEDLTKRGRTEIVRKVVGPEWRPTPAMKIRNPEWPDYVGPGPDNPLGTHAMYLSWQYYRIHGTQDTRKIGRKSSNGCIGLYNEHIAELFSMTDMHTPVVVI